MPIWNVKLQTKKPIREYPKADDLSLGAALKRERLNRGWTQEQVAFNLNILRTNYVMFERNNNLPDVKKRRKINTFLGFNFWDNKTESLANKLLLYRIEHQLSAKELGKIIGVSRNTIKRIELNIKTSNKIKEQIATFITPQTISLAEA